jgi:hypothetical protein
MDIESGRKLSQVQREALTALMHEAFVSIRSASARKWGYMTKPGVSEAQALAAALGWAETLAEAMHNIPLLLWDDRFDFRMARLYFEEWTDRYPDFKGYIESLNEIEHMAST